MIASVPCSVALYPDLGPVDIPPSALTNSSISPLTFFVVFFFLSLTIFFIIYGYNILIMKIKNNIILKNNRNMLSGSGMHKHGLMVDLRDYLHSAHDNSVVNNPTYGRVLGSRLGDDAVKIGNINDATASHEDNHSNLVEQFKKISFKDKKKNNIKFQL
jgi:hypothetical protein